MFRSNLSWLDVQLKANTISGINLLIAYVSTDVAGLHQGCPIMLKNGRTNIYHKKGDKKGTSYRGQIMMSYIVGRRFSNE